MQLPRVFRKIVPRNLALERALLVYSLMLGLLLTFLVPPFQKADEILHFYKTVSVSRGNLLCTKNENGVFQNQMPQYLYDFPDQVFARHIAFNPQVPFPPHLYASLLQQAVNTQAMVNESGSCSLPFPLYITTAVGIAPLVFLKANPLIIFYWGRLLSFALAFAVAVYAVYRTPQKLRLLPLFVLSLPMTLHQMGSYSKDALHIAFFLLFFALLLHFLDKKRSVSSKELALFFFSLGVTILARPQYAPLALLTFLPIRQKFQKLSRSLRVYSFFFLVILASSIAWLLSKEVYSADASSLGSILTPSFINPNLQLQYLREFPQMWLSIIDKTLQQQFTFLFEGSIGIFGWLDYNLAWFLYPAYLALATLVAYRLRHEVTALPLNKLFVLGASSIGSILALFLAMYLYASPVAASQVSGLQGRYFIILWPLFLWLLALLYKKFSTRGIALLLSLFILSITYSVWQRYYVFSDYFYAEPAADFLTTNTGGLKVITPLRESVPSQTNIPVAAIRFLPATTDNMVVEPQRLQLRSADCSKLLSETIIDASTLQAGELRTVEVPPAQTDATACVSLAPYITHNPDNQNLELLPNAAGVYFQLLYLF